MEGLYKGIYLLIQHRVDATKLSMGGVAFIWTNECGASLSHRSMFVPRCSAHETTQPGNQDCGMPHCGGASVCNGNAYTIGLVQPEGRWGVADTEEGLEGMKHGRGGGSYSSLNSSSLDQSPLELMRICMADHLGFRVLGTRTPL